MKKKILITTAILATGFTAILMAGPMNGGCDNERGMNGMHGMHGGKAMMNERRMHGHMKHGMMGEGRYAKTGMFHKRGQNPMAMFRTAMKELNLTTEQRQKIRNVMIDQRIKRLQMRKNRPIADKKGMRIDMSKFMSKDKFDAKAFKQVMEEKAAQRMQKNQERRTQRLNMMAETVEKVFNILTPEQREKLIQLSKNKTK